MSVFVAIPIKATLSAFHIKQANVADDVAGYQIITKKVFVDFRNLRKFSTRTNISCLK